MYIISRLVACALFSSTLVLISDANADDNNPIPGKQWMRFANVEQAGFDAGKLNEAKEFANKIGSSQRLEYVLNAPSRFE